MFRKTCSDELFYFGWIFSGGFASSDYFYNFSGLRDLKISSDLALFRSLCNKRQLSRKNKFDKLSGMFPALVFVAFWNPKPRIMQGFGAQTHLFSEVTGPQQFERTKRNEVSNGPQKVTDPIFVNPPPEGLLNNANQ